MWIVSHGRHGGDDGVQHIAGSAAEIGELGTWHQAIDDGARVLFLAGEFDMSNTSQLEHALRAWVGDRSDASSALIVDLGGVRFFDSTGLSALLTIRELEPRVVLRRPSRAVGRLLEIAVPGVFTIEV
jgi:anti-anti-sigma factor